MGSLHSIRVGLISIVTKYILQYGKYYKYMYRFCRLFKCFIETRAVCFVYHRRVNL